LLQKQRKFEMTPGEAQYEVEKYWMGALRRAVQDGDVDYGSVMAGQSVGLVNKELPLKDALASLIGEAEQELKIIRQKCKKL
jgi:enoyl-[acyl-carrier protein] reductase II